jgi:hypothetical protein
MKKKKEKKLLPGDPGFKWPLPPPNQLPPPPKKS